MPEMPASYDADQKLLHHAVQALMGSGKTGTTWGLWGPTGVGTKVMGNPQCWD